MISNRTYRQGLGFEKTMAEMERGRNTQFDSQVVDALLRVVEKNGQEAFMRKYCTGSRTE